MNKHLYDIFASKWYRNNGSVWIYSDPHFNDPEMPAIRKNYIGDEEQIKRINSKVGKYDTIVFLGDIGDIEFIKKIRGYKVLIMGNHDKGASNYKIEHFRDTKLLREFPKGTTIESVFKQGYKEVDPSPVGWIYEKTWTNGLFDEVYEGCLMISDKIILSHEPIEHLPPFMFNIHGHDHSNWFSGSRHLNVCAEHINYTPVNLNSIIKDGLLKDVESIHRTTIDKAIERKAKKEKKDA